jgi:hypothetical protein
MREVNNRLQEDEKTELIRGDSKMRRTGG